MNCDESVETKSVELSDSKGNSLRKLASALNIRTPINVIILATQRGIDHALSQLASIPKRDVLIKDFLQVIEYNFTQSSSEKNDSSETISAFKLKDYAPIAFQYFRSFYGVAFLDFKHSLCDKPMKELSRAGASGSMFYKTHDDMYVLKTVDHREAKFLQGFLPAYFMNLKQNKNTLIPKFFALYQYNSISQPLRFVVMNNLLPTNLTMNETYDIKGSTLNRRASSKEQLKKSPTLKDLDLIERHPKGFILDPEFRELVLNALQRDALVLESYKIMDYSLLIGVHNVTAHNSHECPCENTSDDSHKYNTIKRTHDLSYILRGLDTTGINLKPFNYHGGIPAKNDQGQNLLLFLGIIDILQNYRLAKKLEHNIKSVFFDEKTISVTSPSFYKTRFLEFCQKCVFTIDGEPREILDINCLTSPNVPKYRREDVRVAKIFLNNIPPISESDMMSPDNDRPSEPQSNRSPLPSGCGSLRDAPDCSL